MNKNQSVRKSVRLFFLTAAVSILIAFSFSSCLGDAFADDGTGYPVTNKTPEGTGDGGNSGNGGNGSGKGTGNWMLCKNTGYDIFEMQVWGDGAGEFIYENKADCGRFTVTSKGGGWVGGGLICADPSKTFNFADISKMKFEIRGNVPTKALCIAVQNNGGATATMYPSKTAFSSSAKVASLSETEWQSIELDVSRAARDIIINAFCIIVAGDWGGSFNKNDYFEIRNLDWTDNDGNSVNLVLK